MLRTKTRSPIRPSLIFSPIATMTPQTSAPCMRGNLIAAPVYELSSLSASLKPCVTPLSVAVVTDLEYQAIRVFMSVLLIAADETWIITSLGFGEGVVTSSRYSSLSMPPCPVSKTAVMVLLILFVMYFSL